MWVCVCVCVCVHAEVRIAVVVTQIHMLVLVKNTHTHECTHTHTHVYTQLSVQKSLHYLIVKRKNCVMCNVHVVSNAVYWHNKEKWKKYQ